ncbi:hypothetical protein EJ08DRAFT_660963 [Tothia fuscella]|uniref:Uncharacterized protein n=1 Tax=Tothia fuscella TaxID=1048955 RepID=A0A9P4NRQ5_9PEZI|nr:hypothetical protein EJ08DRAFT_660963 [Tothia fuscella]
MAQNPCQKLQTHNKNHDKFCLHQLECAHIIFVDGRGEYKSEYWGTKVKAPKNELEQEVDESTAKIDNPILRSLTNCGENCMTFDGKNSYFVCDICWQKACDNINAEKELEWEKRTAHKGLVDWAKSRSKQGARDFVITNYGWRDCRNVEDLEEGELKEEVDRLIEKAGPTEPDDKKISDWVKEMANFIKKYNLLLRND